ncbi:MAG: hypothetical protein JWR24_4441 [Actinoallomurus sp.]|nr:hypothetical protein [Actinoallomurus sp.]
MAEKTAQITTEPAVALPERFTGLVRFSDWIVSTEAGRIERRLTVEMAACREFYDAMMVELDDIITYLRTRPGADPSPQDQALLNLVFSLHEVAQAVEIYDQGAVVDGADVRLFTSVLERGPVGGTNG